MGGFGDVDTFNFVLLISLKDVVLLINLEFIFDPGKKLITVVNENGV